MSHFRLKNNVLEIACPDCRNVSHGLDEVCSGCNCEHFRKVRVGDGATQNVGSDAYPFTVIKVSPSGKTVDIQRDDAKFISGNVYAGRGDCIYEFTQRKDAPIHIARWSNKRQCFTERGLPVHVGYREFYQDPSF